MSAWSKSKTAAENVNNGQELANGNILNATTLNAAINNAFYAVDLVESVVAGTTEWLTISSWTADNTISPFTYKATVTAQTTISTNTVVRLVNNNAIGFATYGWSIGSISGQNITIYSIGQPSSSVTLKFVIGG